MATIITLNEGDSITNSRADINTSLANLNSDKIETSVLDTDTTLAANSDSKIATQKAVKAYVDAGGNVNASTTNKGIVEEATQAEVDAGTATGGTGARLFINPSAMHKTVLTTVPLPVAPPYPNSAFSNTTLSDATTANVGLVFVPARITVNKITFKTNTVTTPDTVDISMYTEDGQTRLFSVTTASVDTSATIYTTAVSSVTLDPGNYWVLFNGNNTPNLQMLCWTHNSPFDASSGMLGDVSSEPILSGTLTITSGTPPTTISPTGITEAVSRVLCVRLDN